MNVKTVASALPDCHKFTSRSLDRILNTLSQRELLHVMFLNEETFDRSTSARCLRGVEDRLFFLQIPLPCDDYDYFGNCFSDLYSLEVFDQHATPGYISLSHLEEFSFEGTCDRLAFLLSKCIYSDCYGSDCCDGEERCADESHRPNHEEDGHSSSNHAQTELTGDIYSDYAGCAESEQSVPLLVPNTAGGCELNCPDIGGHNQQNCRNTNCGPSFLRLRIVDVVPAADSAGRLLYLIPERIRAHMRQISINCELTKFEKNALHYFQNLEKLDISIIDNFNLVIDLPMLHSLSEFRLQKEILNLCEIVDLLAAMPNLKILHIHISLFQYTDLDMLGEHVQIDSSVAADRVKMDALGTKQKAARVMRAQGQLEEICIFSISSLPVDLFILMLHCENSLKKLDVVAELVQSEQTAENCAKAEKWAGERAVAYLRQQALGINDPESCCNYNGAAAFNYSNASESVIGVNSYNDAADSNANSSLNLYNWNRYGKQRFGPKMADFGAGLRFPELGNSEFDLGAFDDFCKAADSHDDFYGPYQRISIPQRPSFEASSESTNSDTDSRSDAFYNEIASLTSKLERSVSRSVFYVAQEPGTVSEEVTEPDGEETSSKTDQCLDNEADSLEKEAVCDFGYHEKQVQMARCFGPQRRLKYAVNLTGDDLLLNSTPVRFTSHNEVHCPSKEQSSSTEQSYGAKSGVFDPEACIKDQMYAETTFEPMHRSRSMFNLRFLMQESIHYFQYRIRDIENQTCANLSSNTYTGRQLDSLHERASKLPFCKLRNTGNAERLIRQLNMCISEENMQKYSTQSLRRLSRLFSSEAIENQGYNDRSSLFECTTEMDIDARLITQYVRQDPELLERNHFSYKVFNEIPITNFYHSISHHSIAEEEDDQIDIAVDYKMQFYHEVLPDCMYGILLNNKDFQYSDKPDKPETLFQDLDEDENFQFSLVVFLLSIPQNVMRVDLKKVLFTQTTFSLMLQSLPNLVELAIQELPIFSTNEIHPSSSVKCIRLYNQGYLNVEELPRIFCSLESLDVGFLILSDQECGPMSLRSLRISNSCNLSPRHLRCLCEASHTTLRILTLKSSPIVLFSHKFPELQELYCHNVLSPYFELEGSGLPTGQRIYLALLQMMPSLEFGEYSDGKRRFYEEADFASIPPFEPHVIETLMYLRVPKSACELSRCFAPAGARVESWPE